jgi:alpha-L-fucosidase
VAQQAWDMNKNKHNEICDTVQPRVWGYNAADEANHRSPDDVLKMLESAQSKGCNLLLNTGPLPDGSIHREDTSTLREVLRRLRAGALYRLPRFVQPGVPTFRRT